jgi:hypothetical protein
VIIVIHTGKSFKGAAQYLLHDKRLPGETVRDTDERLAWTHALNTIEDEPERVVREMQYTSYNQSFIRHQAGITSACRPTHVTTMTVSLSWDPSQRPDKEQMIEAAKSFLDHMGWNEHQALLMGHNDTAHPHMHMLINRIHPATGLTLDQNWDRTRASRWGLAYEREHGKIYCEVRELKYERGMEIEGRHMPHSQWKMWNDLSRDGAVDPEHAAALRSGEWDALKTNQKQERLAFWKQSAEQRRQLRTAIREDVQAEFNPDWQAYAKHRDERKVAAGRFDQETRRAMKHYRRHGPLHGIGAVQKVREQQDAYHAQMRQDLFLQRSAIGARMKERFNELVAPALEKLSQDRAHIYREVLEGQGTERRQLHRDQGANQRRPDVLASHANQNQAQTLTPEQIKGYKEHAVTVVAQRAQYAHARDELAPKPVTQDNRAPAKGREQPLPEAMHVQAGKADRERARQEARMAEYQAEYRQRQSGRDRGGGRDR